MANVIKADLSLGSSYAVKNLSLPSEYYGEFNVAIPTATLTALQGHSRSGYGYGETEIIEFYDGLFIGDSTLGGVTDPASAWTDDNPNPAVDNVFSADTYHQVRFHVNGSNITWSVDGVNLWSAYNLGYTPPSSQDFWIGGYSPLGELLSDWISGEIYYIKNIKFGTTLGGSEIWSAALIDFSDWDSTVGDVSIVSDPFSGSSVFFTLSATPSSLTFNVPGAQTVTIDVNDLGGDSENVVLTASYPSGFTGSFSPSTVAIGSSSTFTVIAAPGVSTGTYTITVTGTGQTTSLVRTTIVTITVEPNERKDSIADPIEISGNYFSYSSPSGDSHVQAVSGAVIKHNSVLYASWTELWVAPTGITGTSGPFMAKWDGTNWNVIGGAGEDDWGPFASGDDYDTECSSQLSAASGTDFHYISENRREVVMASDEENIYVAYYGRQSLDVGPHPHYGWIPRIFKWNESDGWTDFGWGGYNVAYEFFPSPDWGLHGFSQVIPQTDDVGTSHLGLLRITASPNKPGACYIAYACSDSSNYFYWLLGFGTADGFYLDLSAESPYSGLFAQEPGYVLTGSGSTLTLIYSYDAMALSRSYSDGFQGTMIVRSGEIASITGSIAASSIALDSEVIDIAVPLAISRVSRDGSIYMVTSGYHDTGSTYAGTLNYIIKGGLSNPNTWTSPVDPDLTSANFSLNSYGPGAILDEDRNLWVISENNSFAINISQLQRVCLTHTWTAWIESSTDVINFPYNAEILGDFIYFFGPLDPAVDYRASVLRQPISRNSVVCPVLVPPFVGDKRLGLMPIKFRAFEYDSSAPSFTVGNGEISLQSLKFRANE